MINYKIEIVQIKKIFEKFVLIVAKHIFLDCFLIFLLALSIGWFSYYKYNIIIQKAEAESVERPFLLEESDYREVISFWQKDEKRFKEADSKKYTSLFEKPVPLPAGESSKDGS
jgi:hypothetical protein